METWQYKKSGSNFELTKYKDKRAIYAFVVNGDIKYIGICESDKSTLKTRMESYRNRTKRDNKTNRRIAKNIKKCLRQHKSVKI